MSVGRCLALWLAGLAATVSIPRASDQTLATLPTPRVWSPRPAYPVGALEDAVVGRVEVDVMVGVDGRPRDPKVVTAVPPDYGFEKAATDTVMGWRFTPAVADGNPVEGSYRAAFDFRPTGSAPIHRWKQVGRQAIRIVVGPGSILLEPAPGWVRTTRQFSDSALSLQFRMLEPGSDAGLLLRAELSSFGEKQSFYRINLTDRTTGEGALGRVGAEKASMKEVSFDEPALVAAYRPSNEWQTLAVTAQNDTIVVTLNAVRVSVLTQAVHRVGYIGLEARRGRTELRNIAVTRLDAYFAPLRPGELSAPLERAGKLGLTYPVPLEQPRPSYSYEAMRNRKQGVVWLEMVVHADGTVGQVRVVKSLDLDLDQQAVGAVRRWRFKPALKDGHPVPCIVEAELTFTLK